MLAGRQAVWANVSFRPKGLWCTSGFKLPGLFYLFVCFFGQLIVHGVNEKVTKTKPICDPSSVFKASLYLSDYWLKAILTLQLLLFMSKRSHCFHCCYCYCYFILFLFFVCDAEVPNKCLCHHCHFSVWLSSRVVFLWGVITASVRHLLVPGHLGKWWEAICRLRRKRTSLLCLRFGDVGLRWKKTLKKEKKERKKNQGHGQPLAF